MPSRCHYQDCDKEAAYGYRTGGKREFCSLHKHSGMINMKNKTCELCYARAIPKSRYCKEHCPLRPIPNLP